MRLVLAFTLLLPVLAGCKGVLAEQCVEAPIKGLFYQPLNVDLEYSTADWQQRFQQLGNSGFTTITLQWTAYGESNFLTATTSDGQSFINSLAQSASEANITLNIGLIADPEWFAQASSQDESFDDYLYQLRYLSLQQAQEFVVLFPEIEFSSWYLPEEINDVDWKDPTAKAHLISHLQLFTQALDTFSPGKNVALSSFAVGGMTATEYAQFWNDVLKIDSLVLWHQDGAGTGVLPTSGRNSYIRELFNTLEQEQWGVIVELFRQQDSPEEEFSAVPALINDLQAQLNRRHRISNTIPLSGFSLRYLFDENNKLLNDYTDAYCP